MKEKLGANVELGRECLLDEGCCVGAREHSRTCLQGLESEKGGIERVDSAIEGQSLLPSWLRHIRGNEVIERSNPFSTYETCWGASWKESDGTDGRRLLCRQFYTSSNSPPRPFPRSCKKSFQKLLCRLSLRRSADMGQKTFPTASLPTSGQWSFNGSKTMSPTER